MILNLPLLSLNAKNSLRALKILRAGYREGLILEAMGF